MSEQPSLTFGELLERWKALDEAQCDHNDTCCHGPCADELQPLVVRLEALASEWEVEAQLMQAPGLSNTDAHHSRQLRAILGTKTP